MKPLVRTCFVALIVLGLASQTLRAGRGEDDTGAKAALVGRLAGLGVQATDVPDSNLLMARSPLCRLPFLAGLLHGDGAEDETARQFSRPDIVLLYVYLGAVEAHPSQAWRAARRGWAALLFQVGLRRSKPPSQMAMVAYPRDCTGLGSLDWAALSPK
jgi:hypothetical protein